MQIARRRSKRVTFQLGIHLEIPRMRRNWGLAQDGFKHNGGGRAREWLRRQALDHQIVGSILRAEFVQSADVRVPQQGNRARLSLEALPSDRIR